MITIPELAPPDPEDEYKLVDAPQPEPPPPAVRKKRPPAEPAEETFVSAKPKRATAPAPKYDPVREAVTVPGFEPSKRKDESEKGWSPRFTYLLFSLTLIPLMFHICFGSHESTVDRIVRDFAQAKSDEHAEQPEKDVASKKAEPQAAKQPGKQPDQPIAVAKKKPTPNGRNVDMDDESGDDLDNDEDGFDLRQLIGLLPEKKLSGALLSADSYAHWAIGIGAALFFTVLICVIFDNGNASLWHVLGTGFFTATLGVLTLLVFQFLSMVAVNAPFRLRVRGSIIFLIIYAVLVFFAFSYHCAGNTDGGFLLNFFGYTCGVGFCEEVCKALPLLIIFSGESEFNRKACTLLGIASGVGFGVSEGIMYSGSFYNGIEGIDIYLVRFISCVGLHGIWAASMAILICKHQVNLPFTGLDDDNGFLTFVANMVLCGWRADGPTWFVRHAANVRLANPCAARCVRKLRLADLGDRSQSRRGVWQTPQEEKEVCLLMIDGSFANYMCARNSCGVRAPKDRGSHERHSMSRPRCDR